MEKKINRLIKKIQKLATIYGKTVVYDAIKEAIGVDTHHHEYTNLGQDHGHVHDNEFHKKFIDEKHYEIHKHKE